MGEKIPFWKYSYNAPPRVSRVTGVALVVFLAVYFAFILPELWSHATKNFKLLEGGIGTQGTVLRIGSGGGSGIVRYSAQVEYQDRTGVAHQLYVRSWWTPFLPGDRVPLLYDPDEPSTVEASGWNLAPPFIGLVFFPLVVYWLLRLVKASFRNEPTPVAVRFSKKTNRFMNRLFLGLFLCFCAYEAWACVAALLHARFLSTKGVETGGTVEEIVWQQYGGGSGSFYGVVSFTDGQGASRLFLTLAYPLKPDLKVPKGPVRILYDPQNPKDALLKDFYQMWGRNLGCLILSLFPLAWFFGEAVLPRLKKKNRAAYEVILGGG